MAKLAPKVVGTARKPIVRLAGTDIEIYYEHKDDNIRIQIRQLNDVRWEIANVIHEKGRRHSFEAEIVNTLMAHYPRPRPRALEACH